MVNLSTRAPETGLLEATYVDLQQMVFAAESASISWVAAGMLPYAGACSVTVSTLVQSHTI